MSKLLAGWNLYVWADPYPVSYGSSMVFSVGRTEDEARKRAEGAPAYSYGKYSDGHMGKLKLGTPTRIVPLPCAEWHKWEE